LKHSKTVTVGSREIPFEVLPYLLKTVLVLSSDTLTFWEKAWHPWAIFCKM